MKRLIAISLAVFTLAVVGLIAYGFASPEKRPRRTAAQRTTADQAPTTQVGVPAGVPTAAPLVTPTQEPGTTLVPPGADAGEAATASDASRMVLTLQDVAKHNTAADCWLLIGGKAYDITQYIAQNLHPDGNGSMVPSCGTESTQAYETQGRARGRSHSARADAELAQYYIGDVTP